LWYLFSYLDVLCSYICVLAAVVNRLHLGTGKCIPLPLQTQSNEVKVGCLMMRQIVNVNWRYIGDAVPAFVTVMFIPFGYSAAYGLIAGLMTYTTLNGLIWITKIVTRGHVVPHDEDNREYWTSEYISTSCYCTSD
jgi:AGZA family xanthine/uracil permease-like MFS transporter